MSEEPTVYHWLLDSQYIPVQSYSWDNGGIDTLLHLKIPNSGVNGSELAYIVQRICWAEPDVVQEEEPPRAQLLEYCLDDGSRVAYQVMGVQAFTHRRKSLWVTFIVDSFPTVHTAEEIEAELKWEKEFSESVRKKGPVLI